MRSILLLTAFFLLTPSLFAQTETWLVSSETVPCSSGECLLVKQPGQKEFEIFYDQIEGFDYQKGMTYSLLVRKEIKKPPIQAEESVYRYFLVNIISSKNLIGNTYKSSEKIPKSNIQTSSSLDTKWSLRKMNDSETSAFETDDNVIWIELNTFTDHCKGYGACNKFEAVLKSDLNTTFVISKLTAGFVNCGNKKIEDMYFDLLQQADRFEIVNRSLILSKQWKYLMEFTNDPESKGETRNAVTYQPTSQINSSYNNKTNEPTVSNTNVDDLQRQIDELKQQLAAKQLSEIEKQKQAQEEVERQKAAELLQQQKEQERLKKQKEIEDLKKQLAEKEKEISDDNPATTYNNYNSNTSVSSNQQLNTPSPSSQVSYNKAYKESSTAATNNSIDETKPMYLLGDKLIQFENVMATFHGDASSGFLLVNTPKSNVRFSQVSLPKIIVNIMGSGDPLDNFIISYTVENKKNRDFLLLGNARYIKSSTVNFGYKKGKDGSYQIVFPGTLEPGEYSILLTPGKDENLVSNVSKRSIACFGIDP